MSPVPAAATDGSPAGASTAERVLATIGLVVLSEALLPRLAGGGGSDGGALSIAAQAVVGLCAVGVLVGRGRTSTVVGRVDPWLVALLVVAVASLTQSLDVPLGARRVLAAVAFSAFGLYIADRFTLPDQVALITCALAVTAVLSLATVAAAGSFARMPGGDPAWRGVYLQKNVLARAMALGVAASVYWCAGSRDRRRRLLCACLAAVMTVPMLMARSTTAPIAVLVAVTPLVGRRVWRLADPVRGAVVAAVGAVAGVVGWVVVADMGVLALLGQGPSLNGRLPLWTSVIHAISAHPWLGYGYGTFWRGWSPPSTMVTLENVWSPPHAHNGVLDLALGMGVIGATVWVILVLRTLWTSARASGREGGSLALWPTGFVLLLLVYNVVEVTTTSNALFWAVFVAVSASGRAAVSAPLRRPSHAAPA